MEREAENTTDLEVLTESDTVLFVDSALKSGGGGRRARDRDGLVRRTYDIGLLLNSGFFSFGEDGRMGMGGSLRRGGNATAR